MIGDGRAPLRQCEESAVLRFSGVRRTVSFGVALFLTLGIGGCFYWAPLDQALPNTPPVVEYSSPDAGIDLELDPEQGGVAWVSVFDPDDDDVMDYLWTVSGLGPQGTAQAFVSGNYQGSSIQLAANQALDGRTLTCTVYDLAGASDRRSWTIRYRGSR